MSETVHYKGKLIEIKRLNNESLEDLCERICKEKGVNELSTYNDTWADQITDSFWQDTVIVNDKLYKIQDKEYLDNEFDIYSASLNPDGTIDFDVMYYNGGCCFTEALEEALNNINTSEIKVETTRSRLESWLNSTNKVLDLTDTGTNPRCVENLLKLLGYKLNNTDNLGCTRWLHFYKDNIKVNVFICTETFEITLYKDVAEKPKYGLDLLEDVIDNNN